MRSMSIIALVLTVSGCATNRLANAPFWEMDRCAASATPNLRLLRADRTEVAVVSTGACRAVQSVAEKIQTAASYRVSRVYLIGIEDVNGFAARDKNGNPVVGITVGMLKALGTDDDAWAGLLGHEIAHLVQRHGDSRGAAQTTAQGVGNAVARLISATVPGAGGLVGGTVGGTAAQMAMYGSYTRPQEAEADELGLQWMVAAGYDPRGMSRLFELLGRNASLPAFLSTHPASVDRAERVQRYLASSGKPQPTAPKPGQQTAQPAEYRWYKFGITQQEANRDHYECLKESQPVSGGMAVNTVVTNQNLYNACLAARGYFSRPGAGSPVGL